MAVVVLELDLGAPPAGLERATTRFEFFSPRREMPLYVQWSEAFMRASFGDPLIENVIIMACTASGLDDDLKRALSEIRLKAEDTHAESSLRPDLTVFGDNEFASISAILVIEFKSILGFGTRRQGDQARRNEAWRRWHLLPGPMRDADFSAVEFF